MDGGRPRSRREGGTGTDRPRRFLLERRNVRTDRCQPVALDCTQQGLELRPVRCGTESGIVARAPLSGAFAAGDPVELGSAATSSILRFDRLCLLPIQLAPKRTAMAQ